MKKWNVLRTDAENVRKINSTSDLGPFLSEIVAARGLNTPESLIAFFNGDSLEDPFMLSDMESAVEAINSEIDEGGKIAVFGDYDCDGICATAILYDYLLNMGAEAAAYIPEREDGYGLNEDIVRRIHSDGCSLIVTVDNGISAANEAELIYSLGMKLVVTDHHQPPKKLPRAEAVVDPHIEGDLSSFKNLCGAGVALKLCAALDGGDYEAVCEQYLDLCAIATVADVMPLTGENRVIVRKGMELLKNTDNYGLKALLENRRTDSLNSQFIAFNIAPRINAASRFGTAQTAFDLICSEDDGSAAEKVREIDALNSGRKDREKTILKDLTDRIDSTPDMLYSRILTVSEHDLPHGLIGIIAARLVEIYEKPTVVLSVDDDGVATGSARSVKGFNIFKCFEHCAELFIKFGGHELAGGLTLKESDIPEFIRMSEEYAKENCPVMPRPEIQADKLLRGSDITYDNAASLARLQPCGAGNPEPVFALSGAKIMRIYPLSEGEHTKLTLEYDGTVVNLLMFRAKTAELPYNEGDIIDVMANMRTEEFNGRKSASLVMIDHRPHGIKQDKLFASDDIYKKFRRGEQVDKKLLRLGLPTREELVAVYKAVDRKGTDTFEKLYSRLLNSVNSFKLRIITDIFCEAKLLDMRASDGRIRVIPPKEKADTEKSPTLIKLRELVGMEE